MNISNVTSRHDIPDELIAEASVWVARLHGPGRKEAEHGARAWLQKGAHYARAFELATEVWDETLGLPRVAPLHRSPRARMAQRGLLLAATVACMAVGTFTFLRYQGVSTDVGEQRVLTLDDGSRVVMNTATRLRVLYSEYERRVELKRGEALFEVARRSDRPFIVDAGEQQVRALGTSFSVRRDEGQGRVSVTLVEGKVRVERQVEPAAAAPIALSPGERLIVAEGKAPALDRPAIENVMAWRRGYVVLDDTPLGDAVAEMNRYSTTKLVIERPETVGLLINGLFQVGDTENFAAAVAKTHGIQLVRESQRIVLGGLPR